MSEAVNRFHAEDFQPEHTETIEHGDAVITGFCLTDILSATRDGTLEQAAERVDCAENIYDHLVFAAQNQINEDQMPALLLQVDNPKHRALLEDTPLGSESYGPVSTNLLLLLAEMCNVPSYAVGLFSCSAATYIVVVMVQSLPESVDAPHQLHTEEEVEFALQQCAFFDCTAAVDLLTVDASACKGICVEVGDVALYGNAFFKGLLAEPDLMPPAIAEELDYAIAHILNTAYDLADNTNAEALSLLVIEGSAEFSDAFVAAHRSPAWLEIVKGKLAAEAGVDPEQVEAVQCGDRTTFLIAMVNDHIGDGDDTFFMPMDAEEIAEAQNALNPHPFVGPMGEVIAVFDIAE